MAYSETLAERIREYFLGRNDVVEKRMFGGLAFMVAGHMCVGIKEDSLMARVGPDNFDQALSSPGARLMDFTGRPLKGFVYVAEDVIEPSDSLKSWIQMCETFVLSLPPK